MRSHREDMVTSVDGRGDVCTEPVRFVLQDRCLMCVHSPGAPAAVSSCQQCLHKWHPALVLLRTCPSSHMGTAMHCPYPGLRNPSPLYATQRKPSSLDLFQSIEKYWKYWKVLKVFQNIDCFRLTDWRLKTSPFFFPLGTKSSITFLQTSQHCLGLSGMFAQINGF